MVSVNLIGVSCYWIKYGVDLGTILKINMGYGIIKWGLLVKKLSVAFHLECNFFPFSDIIFSILSFIAGRITYTDKLKR